MRPRKPFDPRIRERKRKPMERTPGSAPGAVPAKPSPSGPDRAGQTYRPPAQPDPSTTDWSDVAQWYDKLVGFSGSEYHREVVVPGIMRLLEPRPDEHIIDVACGQGVLCRLLHAKRVRATGVDMSAELLRMAGERSDPEIKYLLADARNLSAQAELQPATFHAAVCVLAIQNIDPIGPVFEQVARLLVPGGRFVLAMMHPCFRIPRVTSWGWEGRGTTVVQYRRVDAYLQPRKEKIITHPGSAPGQYTWTFHRPLQSYVKALANARLAIDALEEWPSHKESDSGPRAPAENLARREIPLFMAIRAVKAR